MYNALFDAYKKSISEQVDEIIREEISDLSEQGVSKEEMPRILIDKYTPGAESTPEQFGKNLSSVSGISNLMKEQELVYRETGVKVVNDPPAYKKSSSLQININNATTCLRGLVIGLDAFCIFMILLFFPILVSSEQWVVLGIIIPYIILLGGGFTLYYYYPIIKARKRSEEILACVMAEINQNKELADEYKELTRKIYSSGDKGLLNGFAEEWGLPTYGEMRNSKYLFDCPLCHAYIAFYDSPYDLAALAVYVNHYYDRVFTVQSKIRPIIASEFKKMPHPQTPRSGYYESFFSVLIEHPWLYPVQYIEAYRKKTNVSKLKKNKTTADKDAAPYFKTTTRLEDSAFGGLKITRKERADQKENRGSPRCKGILKSFVTPYLKGNLLDKGKFLVTFLDAYGLEKTYRNGYPVSYAKFECIDIGTRERMWNMWVPMSIYNSNPFYLGEIITDINGVFEPVQPDPVLCVGTDITHQGKFIVTSYKIL